MRLQFSSWIYKPPAWSKFTSTYLLRTKDRYDYCIPICACDCTTTAWSNCSSLLTLSVTSLLIWIESQQFLSTNSTTIKTELQMPQFSHKTRRLPFAPIVALTGVRCTCKRVLTTSSGHTKVAAIAPAFKKKWTMQVSTPFCEAYVVSCIPPSCVGLRFHYKFRCIPDRV